MGRPTRKTGARLLRTTMDGMTRHGASRLLGVMGISGAAGRTGTEADGGKIGVTDAPGTGAVTMATTTVGRTAATTDGATHNLAPLRRRLRRRRNGAEDDVITQVTAMTGDAAGTTNPRRKDSAKMAIAGTSGDMEGTIIRKMYRDAENMIRDGMKESVVTGRIPAGSVSGCQSQAFRLKGLGKN